MGFPIRARLSPFATTVSKRACDLAPVWLGSMAIAGTAWPAATAEADTLDSAADGDAANTIVVKGERYRESGTGLDKLPTSLHDTPQIIEQVTRQAIEDQAATRLQDALRYVPGVTLNSGEGGAHGDNVNLRGFATIDDFFVDGIRDPGSYARDSFNLQSIEVLQGPSAVLFGNGSAGGAINQVSKLPTLAPLRAATLEVGSNQETRATADINLPIGPAAALRLNIMGERAEVTDRDAVQQKRWGIAPSLSLGLGEPTTLTLSYFHQEENNVPDYGVPFLDGAPAPVPRHSNYGLTGQDVTETNVNILTATLRHQFSDDLSVTNTFRYANYWSNYRVSSPVYACDAGVGLCDASGGGAPAPGTPLDRIQVYRDRPSSAGTNTYLTDHVDLTAGFDTGTVRHLLVAGIEVGRQTSDLQRFNNDIEGVDGTAPSPLLAPNRYAVTSGVQTEIDAQPETTADTIGVYAIDTIRLTDQLQLDLGVRYDRYDTRFDDQIVVAHFERVDTAWSPKAALVFKPTETESYYFAYTKSFDPVVSYLSLAPDSAAPPPERAKTYEIGAKTDWLGGQISLTASAFRTELTNARTADPNDPTLQQQPGTAQRVQGIEIGMTGHLTDTWEVTANYTYLDPTIRAAPADPAAVGKRLPGAARHAANLWTVYDLGEDWKVGTGINYLGARYVDNDNTARIPSYVVWNAMASYRVTDDIRVQANLQNITDAYYYGGAYFSSANENHVIPGPGRTLTVSTSIRF